MGLAKNGIKFYERFESNEGRFAGMTNNEKEEQESFAELFETSSKTPGHEFSPGKTVSGEVVKITRDTIFVDLGGKSEGFVGIEEFRDKDGNLTLKVGDRVETRVASVREGIHLTRGIKVQGPESLEILREAKETFVPVEGRVSAVKKGGFEVDLSGTRAFCPLSQIDLPFCEKPEEHLGARYRFRVMEVKEKGRNIIVSRRVLLEEEQEKKAKETLAALKPDLELEGKVTKVMAFGAFVDIGGIEGMVHVSEISHARVHNPSEVLNPGQQVKVKVLRIEPDRGDRYKISLSMKALEPDAWERGLGFGEGEIIRGRISRLTEFGAFVEVAPGVDGLVHISEISYDRISHPSKLLHENDIVDVLVLGIDFAARRISLSIKEAAIRKQIPEKEGADEVRLEVGQVLRGIVDDVKPYGLFVRLPQLGVKTRGLLPTEELTNAGKGDAKKKYPKGREIRVEIIAMDEKGRIRLSERVIGEQEDREDYKRYVEKDAKQGEFGTLGDLYKDLKVK
jgi:small subunit ribosomal protein S1